MKAKLLSFWMIFFNIFCIRSKVPMAPELKNKMLLSVIKTYLSSPIIVAKASGFAPWSLKKNNFYLGHLSKKRGTQRNEKLIISSEMKGKGTGIRQKIMTWIRTSSKVDNPVCIKIRKVRGIQRTDQIALVHNSSRTWYEIKCSCSQLSKLFAPLNSKLTRSLEKGWVIDFLNVEP